MPACCITVTCRPVTPATAWATARAWPTKRCSGPPTPSTAERGPRSNSSPSRWSQPSLTSDASSREAVDLSTSNRRATSLTVRSPAPTASIAASPRSTAPGQRRAGRVQEGLVRHPHDQPGSVGGRQGPAGEGGEQAPLGAAARLLPAVSSPDGLPPDGRRQGARVPHPAAGSSGDPRHHPRRRPSARRAGLVRSRRRRHDRVQHRRDHGEGSQPPPHGIRGDDRRRRRGAVLVRHPRGSGGHLRGPRRRPPLGRCDRRPLHGRRPGRRVRPAQRRARRAPGPPHPGEDRQRLRTSPD